MSVACRQCGQNNREGARFCDGCGAPVAAACSACGHELRPEARFCDACGAPVGEAAPTAAVETERSPADYTPRHLVDKILRSRSAIEGERKQVTVLFADLMGSMDLSEKLGAETWHHVLERFFSILTEGVHRFEGTINQYTGDGIMALFGAPIAHEDHAQRACFTALHLHESLRELADELRRAEGLSLSTRIGINSGEVVVGKIGDDLRMDYTAQGHTVGLAKRMEERAAPDTSCLSEHTARLVEGYFDLRDLGEFDLKGVTGPTRGYALEGLGAIRTRLERSRERGFSRFVGRGDELDVLESALDGALQGRGNVVGVVAEAGVGKSRLCLEFVEHCRERGIAVFDAHCPSHGRAIPLLPVLELLRGVFTLQEGDDDQLAREKIAGRLLLLDREFEPLLPIVFDLLGVADPAAAPPTASPEVRQRQLLSLTRRLVQARSEREPAVLLVDDVHWIDPASDTFLEALAETAPDTRTLLLLNFRPEYSAPWMTRSTYQQLPLQPLGAEATDALLADLAGDDPSIAALLPLVRDRSGGNPFYVEEIVQNLREARSLRGDRGALRLTTPVERVEVPSTVQAILGARIDRLPEREKHLLQTAAAIGRRFNQPLLRSVCGLRDEDFDEAVRALTRGEFIYEESIYPDVEHAFRHPLTHEVAERSQLADRRREVHRAVATELERVHGNEAGDKAALLAHHWDEAGETTPAAEWHRLAAEWIAGSNPPEAIRHWQRVRALSERIDDEALAAELGARSRLMILEFSWRVGSSEEETGALLAEGEEWARSRNDDHALAALYNAYSMPAILTHGQTERAADAIDKGLRHVARTNDRPLHFALELRRFLIGQFRGRVDDMLERFERLRAFSRAEMEQATPILGYYAPALVDGYEGDPYLLAGRLAKAISLYRRGIETARRADAVEVMTWLLALEAGARRLEGDLERATAIGQDGLRLSEQIESNLSIALSCIYLSAPLLEQGQVAEAIQLAERGVELTRDVGRTATSMGLATLARAYESAGRHEDAVRAAREAVENADAMRLAHSQICARLAAARVEAAGGDEARAREHLDEAERTVAECGARVYLAELAEIRAELAERFGDSRRAAEHLRRARDLYREFGAPLQVRRLEAVLG